MSAKGLCSWCDDVIVLNVRSGTGLPVFNPDRYDVADHDGIGEPCRGSGSAPTAVVDAGEGGNHAASVRRTLRLV